MSAQHPDPFDDTTNHIPYHRQLQNDHAFPLAPPSLGQGRRVPSAGNDKHSRSQQPTDSHAASHQARSDSAPLPRPSYPDESKNAHASPTKRSFFGGIGRDRKASVSSIQQPVPHKPNFSHSPLSKGHRPEPSTSNYAQFSKSQSDLHARSDFSSPTNMTVELPRVPAIYQQNQPASAEHNRYLRSPSPAMNFSRSVDDLSSSEQPTSPFPASPGYDDSTSTLATNATPTSPATWGEHGVPSAHADWRPSDMGTLASPTQQQPVPYQRFKPGHHKLDSLVSQVQPSSGSVHTPPNNWSGMSPPQNNYLQSSSTPKHARKVSKLSGKEISGRGVVATSLAASLGLTNLGGASSTLPPLQSPSEPVPLPPGAVFQGFVNRNANISLTLAQLSGHDNVKSKDKEKDIAKGWKPYRVVLQDGRLCFYKPPGNISDEVKGLFPTGIVRTVPDTPASSTSSSALNADMLMKSGLSKQDLLSATSSTNEMISPLPSPTMRPRIPALRQNSNKTLTTSPEAPVTPNAVSLPPVSNGPVHRSWVKPGKHSDLVLVDSIDAPLGWSGRIQSGSLPALAHEFVEASQLPSTSEAAPVPKSRRSIASPLIAQTTAGRSDESMVEAFVVAVLTSTIAEADRALETSKKISTFISEVNRRAKDRLAADEHSNDSESSPALKSRLAVLLDVALRSGMATSSDVADGLRSLAAIIQCDDDELKQRMDKYTVPIVEADSVAAGGAVDWISRVAEGDSNNLREELRELRTSLAISDQLLLRLEPLEIAQQIQIYHANGLRRLVGQHLSFIELIETAKTEQRVVAAFSFDSLSPHPITTLALKHLLDSSSLGPDKANIGQTGARHRASVLRHWIAIASYLLTLGDVAGWIAVCTALCSRAVTRLEQTWRYLAEGDRVLVAEEWAPILSSISWIEGLAVNVRSRFVGDGAESSVALPDGTKIAAIPFLGNALYRTLRQPENVLPDSVSVEHVKLSSRAEDSFYLWKSSNDWRAAWQQAASEPLLRIAGHTEPLAEYQATFDLLFQDAAAQGSTFESNMERSFHLEPKALGNLDARERHWLPSNAHPGLPLVPLLFPQPLPLLSLTNAAQIKAEIFRREDPRTHHGSDPQATITSRSITRPALAGSPLIRSSAFSPPLGSRVGRSGAFSGIIEWSSSVPSPNWEDASSSIVKVGNELVLRVVQEANLSLPNSPMTGKRFSQDFGRASRPLSQISKRSSLPTSNRSSVVDIVVPLQVVVKAATLDRMIDLLVMGVQHVDTSLGATASDGADTQSAPTRKTKLVIDMENYRTTFLATYRSLCSPSELFQQLQKRFSAAITASKELAGADEFRALSQFPSWIDLTPVGSQAEPTDWDMVYRIRMGAVLTLRLWIDRFPQDFVDDDVLYQLALGFFRQPGLEITAEDPDQQKIVHALAQLRSMFSARIMGANARQEERSYATDLPVHVSNDHEKAEFDFDRASPADLVEYLESIATVFFDKIIDRDLLVASEIFEKQASHPAAWFTVKAGSTGSGEEDKPVTNMYTMLDLLKASRSTGKDGSEDVDNDATLQQKLPSAIRDALAAQSLFRGWIAIHIIESGIGLERRQERLSKLLDALWICRARMLKLRSEDTAATASAQSTNVLADPSLPFREPIIGSFVESAIVNTLGSSESRIFLRAWQGVAASRGAKGEGLDDLFPKQVDPDMRAAVDLSGTPDIGWILACLAEAATKAPSVQDSAVDVDLIDFEKRRTMWALIDGAVRVRPACNVPDIVDLAGARLRVMQSALTRVVWDRRAFREDAGNEMRNAPPVRADARVRSTTSSKALPGLSKQQQAKLSRDRAALEMLNSLPLRPSISNRVSSMPSTKARASVGASPSSGSTRLPSAKAAMTQAPPPDKTTIRARRMTALFKGAVRPLISLDKPDAPAKSVTELMRLTPLQKPSIIAGLGGARVSVWNNMQRSFVFHLTSQEGAKYLLQTTNAAELTEWIAHIERASRDYAPLKPMDARKGNVSNKGKAAVSPLYGRPLPELVEREGHSVPTAVERMFAEIEARGLREQGIYRISGSKSAVENLRRAWDQQPAESIDLSTGEFSDIHTIAGAVKAWLRDLPEPLITFDSYDDLIATNAMENDERLYAMRDIIWKMPRCHFDVLRRTAEHLARVVEEGEINKMLAHNVALVFGTSLLNPPPGPSSVAIGFGNLGKAANVVKTIVTMHEWLFEPEPEPEPEPEAEPEVETQAETQAEAHEEAEQVSGSVQQGDASGAEVDDSVPSHPPANIDRAREASLSSSNDSASLQVGDEGENEPILELPTRARRGGRGRPLTIVGLDGLSALGGSAAIAKVLESGEDSTATAPDTNDEVGSDQVQADTDVETNIEASMDSQATLSTPRIVLSGDAGSDAEALDEEEGSQSEGDDSHEVADQTVIAPATQDRPHGEETEAVTAIEDDSTLAVSAERRRKTRSTYRDSVFTSYSIYADCFDNMKLESQSSAASMVKRQSMHLLGQPSAVSDAEGEAKVEGA